MTPEIARVKAIRDEAKALGKKRYFTGVPCKRGHIVERFISTAQCVECSRMNHKTWYECDGGRDKKKSFPAYNTSQAEYRKRAKAKDPVGYKAMKAKIEADRRGRKRANSEIQHSLYNTCIRAIIEFRNLCTTTTGIKHHVDHIIPLSRGGKHVPWNLQVISATENMRKYNRLPEEIVFIQPA